MAADKMQFITNAITQTLLGGFIALSVCFLAMVLSAAMFAALVWVVALHNKSAPSARNKMAAEAFARVVHARF